MGIFNSGKKAAKIAAKATMDSANMQAAADRVAAQASVNGMETLIAQKVASQRASDVLSVPQGRVDVQLSPEAPQAEIDPATGRRKTRRSQFRGGSKGASGVHI